MRWRLLRDERGFTLAEMTVTMMVMIIVMFGLYSIFDMSMRVYGVGNDKVEATQNARMGLDKISREATRRLPREQSRRQDPTVLGSRRLLDGGHADGSTGHIRERLQREPPDL